jgi:hypothetical protein
MELVSRYLCMIAVGAGARRNLHAFDVYISTVSELSIVMSSHIENSSAAMKADFFMINPPESV